jgi:type IV secretory pathway TrbD component
MSAGMIIAIVILVLLLWLVIGGMVAALVGPFIKQAASRVPPSPKDHSTFSESPVQSVSKT